jgi:hypothetical protein
MDEKRAGERGDNDETAYNGKEAYSTRQNTLNSPLGDVDSPEMSPLPSTFNHLSPTTVLHPNPRRSQLWASTKRRFSRLQHFSTPVLLSNGARTVLEVHDKDDIVVLNANTSSNELN